MSITVDTVNLLGRQLKSTSRCRFKRFTIMLLTSDCRHSILHDLRRQNAIDTLVVDFCHPFPQRLIRQVSLIRFFLSHHVTKQFQRVHHRIVIVGDMNLVAMHLGPELRPAAILILSAQQIFHTTATKERLSTAICLFVDSFSLLLSSLLLVLKQGVIIL